MTRIKNEKGVTQIIVVVAITLLIASTAMVIDVGSAIAKQNKLSNALDAAVLAGVMELPRDPVAAEAIAKDYLKKNGFLETDATFTIKDNNKTIAVVGAVDHQFYLASVIGIKSTVVNARSMAIVGPADGVKGLRPFGVEEPPPGNQFVPGQEITLKEGGGDGYHGNFGAVAFSESSGASDLLYNILNGTDEIINIGDIILTEPGNMVPSVKIVKDMIAEDPFSAWDTAETSSPRMWLIPIVDTMTVSGRDEVTVEQFAYFFVDTVGTKAGKVEITGRFVEGYTASGTVDPSAPFEGVYATKLVQWE